jgi:SEC-C motif
MSSAAQFAANLGNAQASTGPRTETGKAKSAKNAITFGLFSGDFIRPGEEEGYAALHTGLIHQLAPGSLLEDILVEEIHRATWRLRRCGEVESHLVIRLDDRESYIFDPMETSEESAIRIQKSVDRARSQAHRLLHKCTAELRKLKAERKADKAVPTPINSAEKTVIQQTRSQEAGTPRNAPCPCGSGQKHKRCCGRNAPAVLNAA